VFWQAVLPVCTYKGRKLAEVRLYPVDLGYQRAIPQRGRPMLAEGKVAQEILTWLRDLSKPLGTDIRIDGDVGIIRP
jgi:poly-gamma-glutamate synthesis protein (capsule biosynthesis protein)